MASPAYKLTVSDTVFVNALSVLVLPVRHDVELFRTWREVALDVRPGVNRDHSFVGPLVGAFSDWDSATDRMLRERARIELLRLLTVFYSWRGGLALATLRKTQDQEQAA